MAIQRLHFLFLIFCASYVLFIGRSLWTYYKCKIKNCHSIFLFFLTRILQHIHIQIVNCDFHCIEIDHKGLHINVILVIQCNENIGLDTFFKLLCINNKCLAGLSLTLAYIHIHWSHLNINYFSLLFFIFEFIYKKSDW